MARENIPERGPDGKWKYPPTADVLEEVGLRTVEEYIQVRRRTIAAYVVDRPILEACRGGTRKRGSARHQYWWEQPLELDDPVIFAGEVDGDGGAG